MKLIILFCLQFCLLLTFSCKKKEKSDTTDTPGTPVVPTKFNGQLAICRYTVVFNNFSYVSDTARAFFTTDLTDAVTIGDGIRVSSVFVNGDSLRYSKPLTAYKQDVPLNSGTEIWSVTGSPNIPSFTFDNTIPFPGNDPVTSFPDSIRKSVGFTVTINNISNARSAFFMITDGVGTSAGNYTVALKEGNNTVNVSAENLSGFSGGGSGYMAVNLENFSTLDVNSKYFKFSKVAQYTRYVKIKP